MHLFKMEFKSSEWLFVSGNYLIIIQHFGLLVYGKIIKVAKWLSQGGQVHHLGPGVRISVCRMVWGVRGSCLVADAQG